MSDIAIVTTTIGIPKNLPDIYVNQRAHDHDNVHYYVVGDNKTPIPKVNKYLGTTIPKEDFTVLNMRTQKAWLKKNFGRKRGVEYERVFQENNYQRRIIGFLMAKQDGAKKIIVVDDDNFPHPEDDFVGLHINTVGVEDEHLVVSSDVKYIDLMSVLKYTGKEKFRAYVRGFPLFLRGNSRIGFGTQITNPAVNIGLWEQTPDISAISRIVAGDLVVERNPKMFPIVVPVGEYTSMCMQNLCFDTDFLITQYEFPMNVKIGGITLGRYDDIWAGYICKKILDICDRGMTFGPPQAIHRRNVHDFQKDFIEEFWGLYINDVIYNTIATMEIDSTDSWSAFTEIIMKMSDRLKFFDYEWRDYFSRVYKDMHDWAIMNMELFGK